MTINNETIFFVLNGLVNGETAARALRAGPGRADDILDDGFYFLIDGDDEIGPDGSGPYSSRDEATEALRAYRSKAGDTICPISLFAALTLSNLKEFSIGDANAYMGVEGDGYIGEIDEYTIIVDNGPRLNVSVIEYIDPDKDPDRFKLYLNGCLCWSFDVDNVNGDLIMD